MGGANRGVVRGTLVRRCPVHGDGSLGGAFGGLAGRGLAKGGAEDVAHEDFIDLVGGDVGGFESGLDGVGAELGGGEVAEGSLEGADGSAHPGDDVDVVGHGEEVTFGFGGRLGSLNGGGRRGRPRRVRFRSKWLLFVI